MFLCALVKTCVFCVGVGLMFSVSCGLWFKNQWFVWVLGLRMKVSFELLVKSKVNIS